MIPEMKATGRKTAISTSAIPTTAPDTSRMASSVASLGPKPLWAMLCSTASTTTMASSTTIPIASTRPKSVRTLTENPNIGKKMKVPTSDTGTVSSGISVARQFCRKMNTTIMTRMTASYSVLVTSWMDSRTNRVLS